MFKNVNIRTKLLISFLAVGAIPCAVIGITYHFKSSNVISSQAVEKLKTVQQIKKAQVEDFFKKCLGDISILSKNSSLAEALTWFKKSFNDNGKIQESAYRFSSEKHGTSLGQFIKEYGYYDLLLITPEGEIVYSYKRENDLGQNVITGPLKNSHLGRNFSYGLKGIKILDFETYAPSGNRNISFILAPYCKIESSDSVSTGGKEILAVLALKLDKNPINTIVQLREGMGETGETYVVGKTNGKTAFRSDSAIRNSDNSIQMGKEASIPFLSDAFSGTAGFQIYNNRGREQLIYYNPLDIKGLNWVIVSKIDTDEAFEPLNAVKWMMTIIASICIAAILVVGLLITNSIIRPINNATNRIKDIAEGEGDLTARIIIENHDEMGELAKWFNSFIDRLQIMIRNISENSEALNESSSELSNLSEQMSEHADQMSANSSTVASSGVMLSVNMDAVAKAMVEASNNISMVAASAEEMTATINDIARNSENARVITGEAVNRSQTASDKVNELGKAAQEISKVTETINDISDQTNLLALNATIEAARAGEAGKGFAVVANEIKELARQTTEATREIKERIDRIQNSTSGTVSEIEAISKVINNVDQIVSTIATAVEEQSVTTNEIAGNVAQASNGIQEVNENVSQSSILSNEISKDISDVYNSAEEMANGSSQISFSAEELTKLSGQLKELVNKLKV